MTKVFFERRTKNYAIKRIIAAMHRYMPERFEVVRKAWDADLIILHVIGRVERTTRYIEEVKSRGKQYAIVQYSLRSTQKPWTDRWMPIWRDARLVWSYLMLNHELEIDGNEVLDNFYCSALGVDSEVFKPYDVDKEYLITTTGHNYLAQSVREVMHAARDAGGKVAHVGPDLGKSGIDYYTDISDQELATLYSKSHFVSGLRRVEGFEMPAAEGLMCGARPIVFDRLDQTNWYRDLAVIISEYDRKQIIKDLVGLFQYEPVIKQKEIDVGKHRFSWERIITGFWDRL